MSALEKASRRYSLNFLYLLAEEDPATKYPLSGLVLRNKT